MYCIKSHIHFQVSPSTSEIFNKNLKIGRFYPGLPYLWPNLKLLCCLGTQSLPLGGALTYKSDIGAHTDASNRGTISDNFLAKRGWVIWLIRWQIQKRGVIWHEIAQNPGNFNTFLISLENFDRKSNNWGSLGVKSCKKGRHSVKKKKKRCKKGGLLSGGWHIPANGSVPPQALDLMKFIPI